ncbi:MAG: Arc family DNA-binding protein [bacterium]
MSTKKSFVLRLNTEMYESLEKWAEDEFRSTNGQLEWIISEALRKAGRLKKTKEERIKNKEQLNTGQ